MRHRALSLPWLAVLILAFGCTATNQAATPKTQEIETPSLATPTILPDMENHTPGLPATSAASRTPEIPSATDHTQEPAVRETESREAAACRDDLVEIQAALSDQWSLLDTSVYPQRSYYRGGLSDFVLRMVSSGNFSSQRFQLPGGSTVVVDTLTAYSVDAGHQLYTVEVAVGAQYPDRPDVLFLNRWSPFEAAITTLEQARDTLTRGRLFEIALTAFVETGEIVRWDRCLEVGWYVDYFGAATCQLGRAISENQPGLITTLIQGGRPPEGEVPLFLGWVIHIPTDGALEWGVLEMPPCP